MLNPGFEIVECRRLKGMSQADLAAKAGLAQANLSNIEKGKRDLTVSTLLRIARALEVKASTLIEEENPPKPLKLTRAKIEKLGEAVLDPGLKVSAEIVELAGLFRQIISEAGPRVSSRKTQLAWTRLRQKLSSREIKGVCARVEDTRQRTYEKKAD